MVYSLGWPRRRAASAPGASVGQLIAAHEAERRRVARQLHDDVGQRLALLSMEFDQLARDTNGDEGLHRRWRDLSRAASGIATDLHRISQSLHPGKLETLGLVAALAGYCRDLWSAERLRVRFTHENVPGTVPADVALCFYRVVQEALENVVQHSGVMEAEVHLTGDGHTLFVRVADAGAGFAALAPRGVGLMSMDERARSVGGRLLVDAAPGHGTRITVKVDLQASGRESIPK
jgi:signal transduction histidine kinase